MTYTVLLTMEDLRKAVVRGACTCMMSSILCLLSPRDPITGAPAI